MRHRTIALAAALLATGAAVPAFGDPPFPPPGPPQEDTVEPDESGCRDIVGGGAAYQQLVASITQDEFAPRSATIGMYKSRVVDVRDKGVATAAIQLAEPSCVDVQYTIEVYTADGTKLLTSHTQAGDGSSGTKDMPLLLEAVVSKHAGQSIAMRVVTSSGSVVHDVGPDADKPAAKATAVADGLPSSPAKSSFA